MNISKILDGRFLGDAGIALLDYSNERATLNVYGEECKRLVRTYGHRLFNKFSYVIVNGERVYLCSRYQAKQIMRG